MTEGSCRPTPAHRASARSTARGLCGLFLVLALLMATSRAQVTYYVDPAATPGGNGSAAAPFASLALAVAAASGNDHLILLPGIHDGGGIDLGQKNLWIEGPAGPTAVVVTGLNPTDAFFQVHGPASGTTRLEGLGFRGASGHEIYLELHETQIELVNCHFESGSFVWCSYNVSAAPIGPARLEIDGCRLDGGRIEMQPAVLGALLRISNSEFLQIDGNPAWGPFPGNTLAAQRIEIDGCHLHDYAFAYGLAAYGADVEVSNSVFEDVGEALECGADQVAVHDCVFRRCVRAFFGYGQEIVAERSTFEDCNRGILLWTDLGSRVRDCDFGRGQLPVAPAAEFAGIRCQHGDLEVRRCRFRDLVAADGAAIASLTDTIIGDCLFQDCVATWRGGAVRVEAIACEILNSTFIDNQAAIGAAIHLPPVTGPLVRNTIIRGGSGSRIVGAATLRHCDLEGGWTGAGYGNFDADPVFATPGGDDFDLAPGSPCLDAGDWDPRRLGDLDLDGNPRLRGNYVDIGAQESPAPPGHLPGSGDDFLMVVRVNGLRVDRPGAVVGGGELVTLWATSPDLGLVGGDFWLLGQLFPSHVSPIPPAGHPAVHLDLGAADLVFGPANLLVPGLPIGGIALNGFVPAGLAGMTYRLQAFVTSPLTMNGWYASSIAVDLIHL
ncbi:MAG: hypothetical protein H6807_12640 [Planctomycetes bacterium]|nr:hypothetical protein [Planctomycetota bacterium]